MVLDECEEAINGTEQNLIVNPQLCHINRAANELDLDVEHPTFGRMWFDYIWNQGDALIREVASLRTNPVRDVTKCTDVLDMCFTGRIGPGVDSRVTNLKAMLDRATLRWITQ